ncbi:MAG: hypothetical protein JWN92_795, partial [Candidatus Acidoferrum typicum]|nr:hypothetical protein [Candidatus Acidoferrum typicum]
MLLLTSTALLRIDTQGRRERESELAWRGEQYQRAIGMYFRKFGKYPTKIDDLVKQTNGVRFLRQAYPDPMNKQDGSWRFIYVGPSGQLIGSLRHTSLLQSLISTPTLPGASALTGASTLPGALTLPGAAPSTGPGGSASSDINTFGQTGQQGQQAASQGFNAMGAQPQSLQGAVIGGNIIGVASKMKESSLRVYQGGDTYETWEFIWNPQTQVAIPGQGTTPIAPGAPGAPTAAPGTPGQSIPGGPLTPPPTDQSGGGTPLPQNPPVQ